MIPGVVPAHIVLAGDRRFFGFYLTSARKLDNIPVLIELKVRLKQHALFVAKLQSQSPIKRTRGPLNRARDIIFRTQTCKPTEMKRVIGRNIQLQITRRRKGLTRFWRLETRCLALRLTWTKIKFRQVNIKREVDFRQEGRIVGQNELIGSMPQLALTQLTQLNSTRNLIQGTIPSFPSRRINSRPMNNLKDRLHAIMHRLHIHKSISALLIIHPRHAVSGSLARRIPKIWAQNITPLTVNSPEVATPSALPG